MSDNPEISHSEDKSEVGESSVSKHHGESDYQNESDANCAGGSANSEGQRKSRLKLPHYGISKMEPARYKRCVYVNVISQKLTNPKRTPEDYLNRHDAPEDDLNGKDLTDANDLETPALAPVDLDEPSRLLFETKWKNHCSYLQRFQFWKHHKTACVDEKMLALIFKEFINELEVDYFPNRIKEGEDSNQIGGNATDISIVVNQRNIELDEVKAGSVLSDLVVPESDVPESVVTESLVSKSVGSKSVLPKSVVPESVVAESVVSESVVPESVVAESVVSESVVSESGVPKSIQSFASSKSDNTKTLILVEEFNKSPTALASKPAETPMGAFSGRNPDGGGPSIAGNDSPPPPLNIFTHENVEFQFGRLMKDGGRDPEEKTIVIPIPVVHPVIPVRNAFIMKIYIILSCQLAVMIGVVFAAYHMKSLHPFIIENGGSIGLAVSLVTLVLLCCQFAREFPTDLILLFLYTFGISLILAYLTCYYSTEFIYFTLGGIATVTMMIAFAATQSKVDVMQIFCVISSILLIVYFFDVIILMSFLSWVKIHTSYIVLAVVLDFIYCKLLQLVTDELVYERRIDISSKDYILGATVIYIDTTTIFTYLHHLCCRK